MATYPEILDIATGSAGEKLRNQVRVAIVVAADEVRKEAAGSTNRANRMSWARSVLTSPDAAVNQLMWVMLAQNRSRNVAQITGATDAEVQTAVGLAIDLLAGV